MTELIYRPQHKNEQELKDDFVIRLVEFEKLMNSIKADEKGKTPQHIILQGQRGMGKTTLMHRVYHQVLKEYRKKNLVPVIFSEEQYSVRTLYKLWEQIALFLEDNEPDYSGIWYQMQDIQDDKDYEEKCFELLQKSITKNKDRLLLLIDNFGVMVDKFSKKDQQRFREILTTFPDIKIIGGSAVILESFYRYDKPFFDFFKIIQLESLSSKEVKTLLLRLGEKHDSKHVQDIVENQSGRMESMRILTGGVPRTIVLLFNIFLDSDHGNSIDDLKELLDAVTPLYKHRMDELPPQQQEIVDKLALNWDGMSVSELVKKTRMESKALSAQLNNLTKSGVVGSRKSTGKNRHYQLEERFFNIWYLMQHAPRSAQQKVIWLTKFLEFWCPGQILEDTATGFVKRLKQEIIHPEYVKAMTYAYSRAQGLSSGTRDELISAAQTALSNAKDDLPLHSNEFFVELKMLLNKQEYNKAKSWISRASFPDVQTDLLIGIVYEKSGDSKKAKQCFDSALVNDQNAMTSLGFIYDSQLEYYQKAEQYYLVGVENGNIDSMFYLAFLYEDEYEYYDRAEKFYLMGVKNKDVRAMNNLGLLYQEQYKDYKKAERYHLMGIKNGDPVSMINLALLYDVELAEYEKAEQYYLMSIKKGLAPALNRLAGLYENQFKDFQKAQEYYIMAVEKGDVHAMFNLALLYESEFKEYDKAEQYYLMGKEKGDEGSVFNLGVLYNDQLQEYDKAEQCYLIGAEKGDVDSIYNLALLYDSKLKNYTKAEQYYLMGVKNGDVDASNNLGFLYHKRFRDYKKAEKY